MRDLYSAQQDSHPQKSSLSSNQHKPDLKNGVTRVVQLSPQGSKQEALESQNAITKSSITSQEDTPSGPPDGGLTAWSQVLAGHLIGFNTWGYAVSFGIFHPYYSDKFSMDHDAIAWVGSVQIFLILSIAAFSGWAFDAGFYKTVLIIGCTLQVVGIMATSVAQEYWQILLAQGFCQGLGGGTVFAPTVANVVTYFSKRKTMAISLSLCGSAVGGMVFPLMAQQLLPKIGFRWTVRAMGLVVSSTSLTAYLLVKPRLVPRKSVPLVDMTAFRESTYLLFTTSMFVSMWAVYFAYFHAREHALNVLHGSEATSYTLLVLTNGVGIPGRIVPAFIADCFLGAVNTFIPILFGAAACVFSWIAVRSIAAEYVWLVIYGFFGAAIQTMFPATLAALNKDLGKAGTRVGMTFSIVSVATLTGPPLAGKLIVVDKGSYLAACIWGGSCLLLGGLLLIAARRASHQQDKKGASKS